MLKNPLFCIFSFLLLVSCGGGSSGSSKETNPSDPGIFNVSISSPTPDSPKGLWQTSRVEASVVSMTMRYLVKENETSVSIKCSGMGEVVYSHIKFPSILESEANRYRVRALNSAQSFARGKNFDCGLDFMSGDFIEYHVNDLEASTVLPSEIILIDFHPQGDGTSHTGTFNFTNLATTKLSD